MTALSLPCPDCHRPFDMRPAVLTGKYRNEMFLLPFEGVCCCDHCGLHTLFGRATEFRDRLREAYMKTHPSYTPHPAEIYRPRRK